MIKNLLIVDECKSHVTPFVQALSLELPALAINFVYRNDEGWKFPKYIPSIAGNYIISFLSFALKLINIYIEYVN